MKDLVENVKSVLPVGAVLAVLPAIIGLLPMPGGAIFSAPLVDDVDEKKVMPPLVKTQINYWFRHLWEYWWPLYPGVILAIQLSGLSELSFMAIGLPLSFISVFAGYFFYLRKIPSGKAVTPSKGSWHKLFTTISPIFILLGVYIGVKVLHHFFFQHVEWLPAPLSAVINTRYFPMSLGIIAAQIYLQNVRPLHKKAWKKIVLSPSTINLALMVLVVTLYGTFIQAELPENGGRVMERMREELSGFGIPIVSVIMLLPFIAGMTCGIAVGMVGASFPVVMGLLGDTASMRELLATTLLAYAMGYMGMMLSPVHICLVVTNEHFKTSLHKSILKLTRPAAVVASGAVVLYWLIRYV
jgi:integral membrane protein (TIGR00529 family)